MSATLLEASGISKEFDGVKALDEVDIKVEPGELLGLIGPNGSGKTTFFNCISGFLKPTAGRTMFKGQEITNLSPDRVALHGMTRTFQQIHVFAKLSVVENLLLSAQQHQGEYILASLVQTARIRSLEGEIFDRAHELLDWGGLGHLKEERAINLSYGQQKILSFLTTLMPKPELILLDEPAAAVNPNIVESMKDRIRELNREGQSFIVVEHNVEFIMDICSRIVVLDHGQIIAEGTPAEIAENQKVLDAYFGT